MTPEQAAFCVLYPDHPTAKALVAASWDEMMQVPENCVIFDEAVQALADEIDRRACESAYLHPEKSR